MIQYVSDHMYTMNIYENYFLEQRTAWGGISDTIEYLNTEKFCMHSSSLSHTHTHTLT